MGIFNRKKEEEKPETSRETPIGSGRREHFVKQLEKGIERKKAEIKVLEDQIKILKQKG